MEGEAGKTGKAEGSTSFEKATPESGKKASARSAQSKRRMLRIGIVALALLVGVIAWVASKGDDGEATPAPSNAAAGVEAKIVSVEELEEFAGEAGHEVYWAGPLPGTGVEVGESAAGNVQIRYLDEGTAAGEGSEAVLTVGSYPLADPSAALEGFAKRKGSLVRKSPNGREVVTSVEKPTSVYFTGESGEVQVEVYAPSYKRAMGLALSDQVRPVG